MAIASIYDISVTKNDQSQCSLSAYRDQVLLIVNTASRCGFTDQYTGLEQLYQQFKDRGFTVLAFPCNQFGAQEPGDAAEIKSFCEMNYRTTFPLFDKVEVNGSGTHPLYEFLKSSAPGLLGTEAIKWNFTKFLVDRSGKVVGRFAPKDTPESLVEKIEPLL